MISKANTHNTIGGSRISATNGKKRKLGIWIGCEKYGKVVFWGDYDYNNDNLTSTECSCSVRRCWFWWSMIMMMIIVMTILPQKSDRVILRVPDNMSRGKWRDLASLLHKSLQIQIQIQMQIWEPSNTNAKTNTRACKYKGDGKMLFSIRIQCLRCQPKRKRF